MLAVGYIRHPKKSYDLSAGETRGPALNYRLRMTSAPGPGRVETPFIPQKLQRMGVVHVDVTV